MKIKVNPHKLEIEKSPVNEKEINITKCEFEFSEEITNDYVKEAYFTLKDNTYKQIIMNDQCDIPSEVLEEKGQIEIGVVAFLVENEEEIKRYNPSPVYITTWEGSLKDAENAEPITPSDKEQIEQQLLNISTQMDNIDIEAEKVDHTTTVTITRKDGTSYDVEILDGEQGPQGEPGQPGAIKMVIVEELPETGSSDTLYFVPKDDPETTDVYDEYAWVNNQWERLGEKQIVVDLTDYVKNTDYATNSKAGVIKTGTGLLVNNNGEPYAQEITYSYYPSLSPYAFIGKGTLENVITGKGLVSNTDYATISTGGVIKVSNYYNASLDSDGALRSNVVSYSDYSTENNRSFISKGTLDNVIVGKDLTTKAYVDGLVGDIGTAIDLINGESVGD